MRIEFAKRWRDRDDTYAVDKNDRAASESLEALRIKLIDGSLDAADGLRLCTSMGTSLALAGASTPFVTSVVTNIATLPETPWREEASVALLEAYVREVREMARADVASHWPKGWMRLDRSSAIAIADPPPDDDRANEWLTRVAAEIARSGVHQVRVTGASATALAQLLGEVGISVERDTAEGSP